MEVSGRASVQEGDEGAVLVWQEADRLNLTTSDVAKDLLSRSVRRDVTEIDSSAGTRDDARRNTMHCRAVRADVLTLESIKARRGRLHTAKVGRGWERRRAKWLVGTWRQNLLLSEGLAHLALVTTSIGLRWEALELRGLEGGRRAWLKGAAHQQVCRQQWCKVHVVASLRSLHVLRVVALAHAASVDRLDAISVGVPVSKATQRRLSLMKRARWKTILIRTHRWFDCKGLGLAMAIGRTRSHVLAVLHAKHVRREHEAVPRIC